MNRLLVMLLLSLPLICQAQKKVALLEPLSGEDSEVTGMEKAMVRGEFRKAIVRVDDFEAITRSDIDRLLSEQDFQRTGLVRDEDIHRIGVMSGADYLCVSTLNKSGNQFYLEAYLVDVTTGEILNPASQFGRINNGNLEGLYQICQQLVKEMIGEMSVTETVPLVETFDTNTWGWVIFVHESKSVQVANGQLRITNHSRMGTTQSSVNLPVDISKNFKITFNFLISKAEMFSSVGVAFAGNNRVTVNTGNCSFSVGDKRATVKTVQMGLGRNRPVVIDIVKEDDIVDVMINGVLLCSEYCPFTTALAEVFAGPNTLAMLQDVTIQYIR